MTSICFFAAYFTSDDLPYYTEVYLTELKKQFDEVVLLCSRPALSEASKKFIASNGITLLVEVNEGFDFGLWYKAFQAFDVSSYDKIALVNDSCILFKSLDEFMAWTNTHQANVKGITRSEAIFPHLQSYFLILDKKAISLTAAYFAQHKIRSDISDVIQTYEVGLSKYWQLHQLEISAFIDNNGYTGEFSPYYHCIEYHLKNKMPVIKKKIIYRSYRQSELFTLARMNFRIDPEYYIELIRANNTHLILDLEKLKGLHQEMSFLDRVKYESMRIFIRMYRTILNKV